MEASDKDYLPGICNIGPGEIRKRRALGWIGLAATLVIWAALIALKSAPAWRLLLFVPAMLAALGFLQAAWRFCAKYGFDNAYRFGRKVGRPSDLDQAESRRKDRQTSLRIIGFSALIGLATAAAGFFLSL